MKLLSYRDESGEPGFGLLGRDGGVVALEKRLGRASLRDMLAQDGWEAALPFADEQADIPEEQIRWLPVVPDPQHIFCVGLNYADHRLETNNAEAEHPAIFMRVPSSQTGHLAALVRPPESRSLDFEGELAIVIGKQGRRISRLEAWRHVAGYSCYNDGTVRDFQYHTGQYAPGKNFPQTGAFGPWLVTPDEVELGADLALTCTVNGTIVQSATTGSMIFDIPTIVEYVSTFCELQPGDVIATGTPGGVGHRRNPRMYLSPGDRVSVTIEGVGTLSNDVRDE